MRPAGTIRPITTSCQPRLVNSSRAAVELLRDCRRANHRGAAAAARLGRRERDEVADQRADRGQQHHEHQSSCRW